MRNLLRRDMTKAVIKKPPQPDLGLVLVLDSCPDQCDPANHQRKVIEGWNVGCEQDDDICQWYPCEGCGVDFGHCLSHGWTKSNTDEDEDDRANDAHNDAVHHVSDCRHFFFLHLRIIYIVVSIRNR